MSLETQVRDELVTASLGVFEAASGWSIHIGRMPKSPNQIILITASGGLPANPRYLLDFPSIQIRTRGTPADYEESKAKLQDIKDYLLGITSKDVDGDRWVSITLGSDIIFLGYDENERVDFALNLRFITEPAAPAVTNRVAL